MKSLVEGSTGFTIYVDPSDCPGCYVMRGWELLGDGDLEMTNEAIGTPINPVGLECLRATLREMGLTCIGRQPHDDPVILESWI